MKKHISIFGILALAFLVVGFEHNDFSHSSRVYLDIADQSIPNDVDTKVQFNAENWDTMSEFDSTTNYRFTATRAGKYCVIGSVHFNANSTGSRQIYIKKNGSGWSHGTDVQAASSGPTHLTVVDVVDMNGTTDYVEIFCKQDSGASLDISDASIHTWMVVYRISQ